MCIQREKPSNALDSDSDAKSRAQPIRRVEGVDQRRYEQLVRDATDFVHTSVFVPVEQWEELERLKMQRRAELRDKRACNSEITDVERLVSLEYFKQHLPDQLKQLQDRLKLFENQFDESEAARMREKCEERRVENQYQDWKRLVMEADDVEGNVALTGARWNEIDRKKADAKEQLSKAVANDEISEEDAEIELELVNKRILREEAFDQVEAMCKEVRYYESKLDEERLQEFRERLAREKANPAHNYITGGYYTEAFTWGCM
jgi:hypothetical protein